MTETIRVPLPRASGGVAVRFVTERNTKYTDRLKRIATEGDFREPMSKVPDMVRFGPGSYQEQIESRTEISARGGARVPWVEPAYNETSSLPPEAQRREQMIWDAALGGPGSVTQTGKDYAEWGIDDSVVKARSTAIGNQLPVPPSVSYAAFVTGGIGVADNKLSRYAIAAKPAKTKRKHKDDRFNKAMYWFLRLTYGYRMKSSELTRGLFTPRKRIGWNPILLQRFRDLVLAHLNNVSGAQPGPVAGRVYPGAGR